MIYWLIGLFLLIWVIAGFIRFFMLMGHKNHKDTLLDKILISAIMPFAYLAGFITYLVEKLSKK